MLVKINNKDMDALKVEEWINTNRDANGGVISPEFAMEILGKTNHFAHIKKVLKNITKACSDENGELVADKVLAYKEFILSCVDGREMSDMAMKDLLILADKCGCIDEFIKIHHKQKVYNKSAYEGLVLEIKKFEDLSEHFSASNLCVCVNADEFFLEGGYLGNIVDLKFKKDTKVYMYCTSTPKKMDFSNCSDVNLSWSKFDIDNEIIFKDGSKVNLSMTKNLPENLDLSNCADVCLDGCNLSSVKELKFRKGSIVSLIGTKGFSDVLDLSMCSEVKLNHAKLSNVKELKFGKGAKVNIAAAELPEVLDLSSCAEVIGLDACHLFNVKKIKFRNKKQADELMNGLFIYETEFEYASTVSSVLGKVNEFLGKKEM